MSVPLAVAVNPARTCGRACRDRSARGGAADPRAIDAAALLAIADKIAAAPTRLVALSGGEPFVVKCLPEIVARLKRARKVVSINTNGHLLADHAGWLVAAGVDHVQVSIDGHDAALHDGVRGRPGSFEAILRGIDALKAARGASRPRISVCGVVMKANAAHVIDLVDRFAAVADAVELQPLHESPGLLATAAPAGFAPDDRPLVEAQMAAVASRRPALANDFYRTSRASSSSPSRCGTSPSITACP